MNDDFSQLQNFNPLWENDTISRINEIMFPITNQVQKIQETFKPILDALEKFKVHFNEIGKALVKASRPLDAIRKMGEAQFVSWDYMTDEFVEAIVDAENINKTLREHMLRDRFHSVNNTIDKTISSSAMQKHKRLYAQSVNAFRSGDSDLAVTGFTSVFDGLLADTSGNPTSRLGPRINAIKQKLDNDELLNHDEFATITLAMTLEKTLDSFSAPSDFKGKEPKGLNRHWIAHGRSTRKKTKLDCVKMINLIYGLLLIGDIESTASSNSSCENGV